MKPRLVIALSIILLSGVSAPASELCLDIFYKKTSSDNIPDPRPRFLEHKEKLGPSARLAIGSGRTATSYLYWDSIKNDISVAKEYHKNAVRFAYGDHDGLLQLRDLLSSNPTHSPQIKVSPAEIVDNFISDRGPKILVRPYTHGINLHELLVSPEYPEALKEQGRKLFRELITELEKIAKQQDLEHSSVAWQDMFFQDQKSDGLPLLNIREPIPLFIKSDNVIFNPEDNSITVIDPY